MRIKRSIFLILACCLVLLGSYGVYARTENYEPDLLKTKNAQYQEALNNLGAHSVTEAARIWAIGIKTRNGALQYSVMDPLMKKSFAEAMDRERPSWVTGISSPWVKKYAIVQKRRAGWGRYLVTIRFDLASSTGSEGSGEAKLLIRKSGSFWVIQNIERGPNLVGF